MTSIERVQIKNKASTSENWNNHDKENKNYLNILRTNCNNDKSCDLGKLISNKIDLKLKAINNISQGSIRLKLESIDLNSPKSNSYDRNHPINYQDIVTNCSLVLSDRNEVEDEEKFNNSTFSIHSNGEASRNISDISFKAKFKTEKCKYWDLNQNCRYGENCAFAHGSSEIRQKIIPSMNYKTKKCRQFFENGFCLYGSRCQFLHKDENLPISSYKNLLKNIEEGNSKPIIHRRLKIFESISHEKKTKKPEKSIYIEKSIFSFIN